VAEPTGALARIANCSCQADPFARSHRSQLLVSG
jgi:hypothetical protein